jgi:STE24 endopeptidase
VLTLIFTVNSRRNEFAADNFAKELGMSSGLQSGLIKIHTGTVVVFLDVLCCCHVICWMFTENLGNLAPDPLYSAYHFSHPSLVERLRALKKDSGTVKSS